MIECSIYEVESRRIQLTEPLKVDIPLKKMETCGNPTYYGCQTIDNLKDKKY